MRTHLICYDCNLKGDRFGRSTDESFRNVSSTASTRPRILVVEDEDKLARAVADSLDRAGYDVDVALTGDEGMEAASRKAFDAIVLDVMLPGIDGLAIVRALRLADDPTPVLILTARDALSDRVSGLDSGADDYLVKPFALPELHARVRALLRRRDRPDGLLRFRDLHVDRLARRAIRAGQEIALTPREFDLLTYLLQHAGHVVSREMLARDVWQQEHRGPSLDNVIDVHLLRLRRKVDDEFTPRLIHTIRGLGVVLADGQE